MHEPERRVAAQRLPCRPTDGVQRGPRTVRIDDDRMLAVEVDNTVRDLRTAIYGLDDQPRQATSLRILFADLIGEQETDLGFIPTIDFKGNIDTAVPDPIATDLLASTRDALTTVAGATTAEITLHVTADELILRVDHNGSAITDAIALPALRARAHSHGGTVDLATRPDTGTRFEWRVPLPHRAERD